MSQQHGDELDTLTAMKGILEDHSLQKVEPISADVLASQVRIELHIREHLPLTNLSLGTLCSAIMRELGAVPIGDLATFLQQPDRDPNSVNAALYVGQHTAIAFSGGGMRSLKSGKFIRIVGVQFNDIVIEVQVSGTDSEALESIERVYNILCDASGINTRFAEDFIYSIAYKTQSIEKLTFSLKNVFSLSMNKVIQDTINSDKVQFRKVGDIRTGLTDDALAKHIVVPKINRVVFDIIRFDPRNGISKACALTIEPNSNQDVDFGSFRFTSDYNNATHAELVTAFKSALPE